MSKAVSDSFHRSLRLRSLSMVTTASLSFFLFSGGSHAMNSLCHYEHKCKIPLNTPATCLLSLGQPPPCLTDDSEHQKMLLSTVSVVWIFYFIIWWLFSAVHGTGESFKAQIGSISYNFDTWLLFDRRLTVFFMCRRLSL